MHAQAAPDETKHPPVFALLSWAIGIGMLITLILGMGVGRVMGWKGQIGLLILSAVPVCTVGTGFAIASLIWRRENKHIVQGALWLNGLLAFFAFPLLCYWLLALW